MGLKGILEKMKLVESEEATAEISVAAIRRKWNRWWRDSITHI